MVESGPPEAVSRPCPAVRAGPAEVANGGWVAPGPPFFVQNQRS